MANVKPANLISSKTLEEYFNQSPFKLIEQQIKKDLRTIHGKIKSANASLYQLASVEEKSQLDAFFSSTLEQLCDTTTRKAFTEITKNYRDTLIQAFTSKGFDFPIVINKKVIQQEHLGKFLNEFISIFPKSQTDAILNTVIKKRKDLIFASDSTLQFVTNFTKGNKNIFELKKHFNNKLPQNIRIRKYDPLFILNNGYTKNIKLPSVTIKQSENKEYSLGYIPYKANDILFATYGGDFALYGSSFDLTHFSQDLSIPALLIEEDSLLRITREFTVEVATIEACKKVLPHAKGNVLIYGLGIGYSAFELSNLAAVDSVTIVEKDPFIIEFFNNFIYEQMPNKEKLIVIESDYFDHLNAENIKSFDTTFIDGAMLINSPHETPESTYKQYLALDIDEVDDNVFVAFEQSILSTYRTLYAATLAEIPGLNDKLTNFNLSSEVLLNYFEKNKVKYLVDFDKAFRDFDLKAIRECVSRTTANI